jgi:hypothetical protein
MNEKIKLKIAKDHAMLGDPIPGSKFYRTFCWSCYEPLRTTMAEIHNPIYCEDCDERKPELYIDLRELHNYPSSDDCGLHATFEVVSQKLPNGDAVFEKKVRRKY